MTKQERENRILKALSDGEEFGTSALADFAGLTREQLRSTIGRMVADGRVIQRWQHERGAARNNVQRLMFRLAV